MRLIICVFVSVQFLLRTFARGFIFVGHFLYGVNKMWLSQ